MNISEKLMWINRSQDQYGMKFTFKWVLNFLGIKNYTTVKLPLVNINVKVRCELEWKDFEAGKKEYDCLKFLRQIVKPRQTVFDVGAHVGTYTLWFSEFVSTGGHVVAFEPSPPTWRCLVDNLEKNSIKNVTAEKLAVTNYVGEAILYNPTGLRGTKSSLIRYTNGKHISTKCTTIDEYCRYHGIVPNGIKIDVEGAEVDVIEGAERTLRNHSVWVLLEFHGFQDERQEREKWEKITKYASNAIYIDGSDSRYKYGNTIQDKPDNGFHAFIVY